MLINIVFLALISSILIGFLNRMLGFRFGALFSLFLICISSIIGYFVYYIVNLHYVVFFMQLGLWFIFGTFDYFWSFTYDFLSVKMFIIVLGISTIVHCFSVSYMWLDKNFLRFMSFLSFFTFFMLILVTADGFIQLFLGWEGVGLCSYLLIGFWYTRQNAIASALKALIVNRISDFALIVGVLICFLCFYSIEFSVVLPLTYFFLNCSFFFFNHAFEINFLYFISFLFLLGAMGKSAQILLHTWLPDAMEGPTPVSALIHAATMVTAGIFLVLRMSTFFEYTKLILNLLLFIGSLTAFMSGTIGVVQYDIKKVIAYSTCSQLGFMLLACGLSNYFVSFFHLINHAFFKAMLFLCAGSVIHSLFNEQDIRRMGGLSKITPLTTLYFLIGTLSISGFVFLTGFYSKDFILEHFSFFYSNYNFSYIWYLSFFFVLITTGLTAFYSLRLFFLGFLELPITLKQIWKIFHESDFFLLLPLKILFFCSIFYGFLYKDFFIGILNPVFNFYFLIHVHNFFLFEAEMVSFFFKQFIFSFVFSIFLAIFIFKLFKISFVNVLIFKKWNYFNIFLFLNTKWCFDLLYNFFINKKILKFAYFSVYEMFDKFFSEKLIGPFFFNNLVLSQSFVDRFFFQSGNFFAYLLIFLFVLFFVFVFLFWFFFF